MVMRYLEILWFNSVSCGLIKCSSYLSGDSRLAYSFSKPFKLKYGISFEGVLGVWGL